MTAAIILTNDQFHALKTSLPNQAINQVEQRTQKLNLLNSIKKADFDKWQRLDPDMKKCLDYFCWLSAELGFNFASHNHIAERYGINERSFRRRLKDLLELNVIKKAYRRNPNGNSLGKPVYVFTAHPNFNQIASFIPELVQEDVQEGNVEILTESKEMEPKSVSTNISPIFKQENANNYIANVDVSTLENLKNSQDEKEIAYHMFLYKKAETEKYGRSIDNPKAFFRKVMDSFLNKALYEKEEHEKHKLHEEMYSSLRSNEPVPEYPNIDWLNDDVSALPVMETPSGLPRAFRESIYPSNKRVELPIASREPIPAGSFTDRDSFRREALRANSSNYMPELPMVRRPFESSS